MRVRSIISRHAAIRLFAMKKPVSIPLINSATRSEKWRLSKIEYFLICLLLFLITIPGIKSIQAEEGAFISIKPPESPNLILQFEPTVHGQPLRLLEQYKNPFGEKFELSIFRFYAGKITCSSKGRILKKIFRISDYHLVDFSDSSTSSIKLRLPGGEYDEIQFQLGIDSADQVRGAQSGALDPLKGMFWTWNSGYISFKIEGKSPESNEPEHAIAYHIGGYRSPNIAVGTVKCFISGHKSFHLNDDRAIRLNIPIELDRFFNGPTPVHIRDLPSCAIPGELAHQLFENFSSLFDKIEIPGKP